jgi:tRNA 5-methylaminomethyl-2-thiouridine biosynthesis bifunctional protein
MDISKPKIYFDDAGNAHSSEYGDIFHSIAGAMDQSDHVFIHANRLAQRWIESDVTILETGFGLGSNFLNVWHHWNQVAHDHCVHMISIEKHPLSHSELLQAHQAHPHWQLPLKQLLEQYPGQVPGIFVLSWPEEKMSLTLIHADIQDGLNHLNSTQTLVDAVFLDGFSPAKNPQMWSPEVFSNIKRLCHANTSLSTWAVSGMVRENLQAAGFQVEKVPGFAMKREMLLASIA